MIVGGENHVFHNLRDQIVPMLRRLPQAVYHFFEEPEVVRTGVGIAEGWSDDGDIVVWE